MSLAIWSTIVEFFEHFTFLKLLSITAFITTVSLFFCGIPICMNIWKRRGTKDISAMPFLMGVLGAAYWLRYGLLKMDYTMISVNVFAVTLMGIYLIFYYFMTKNKLWISIEIIAIIFMISIMLFLVEIYRHGIIDPLGFTCMTFNILNFGAPLAGLRVVLRQRSCDTLPLPLCIANLLVSSQWCLYGVLIKDIYLIIPNGIGMSLAVVQIALFLIFPMKQGNVAPLERLLRICARWKSPSSITEDEKLKKHPVEVKRPLLRSNSNKESIHVAAEGDTKPKKSWLLGKNVFEDPELVKIANEKETQTSSLITADTTKTNTGTVNNIDN